MSRKIARLLSLFLTGLLAISALAGCSQTAGTDGTTTAAPSSTSGTTTAGTTAASEPYVMKIYVPLAGPTMYSETEVGKVIKDKFNIDFECVLEPSNFSEQCSILLASGDYPEVMYLPSLELYQQYIDADALVCLEDYLAEMPEFTKARADQIPLWRSNAADGKLYKWENGSPKSKALSMDDYDVVVRTDLLEDQGWPKTITCSEYINFMKKALETTPKTDGKNTIGMTFAGAEEWGVNFPYSLFAHGDNYFSINQVVAADRKTEQFVNKWSIPEVKESAKFFNDLYQAGLLDKESYSLKDADCQAKMTTGQPAVYFYARWATVPVNDGLTKNNLTERQYIELPICLDSQASQKRVCARGTVNTGENIVITKNCKDPERFLQLLDWWQTDEAQKLYGTGVEDVDYKMENGKRVPLEPLESYLTGKNPDWAMKSGTLESFLLCEVLGARYDDSSTDGQPYRITKDLDIMAKIGLTDRQKEAYTALGWKNHKSWYVDNVVATDSPVQGILMRSVSIDSASDLGKKIVQISEIATKYSSKIVFSKNNAEFEQNYSDMQAEINKLEPEKIVAEYNRLLDEAKVKMNTK